jgi:chitinase
MKILVSILIILWASTALAGTIVLQWDANIESDLAGYYLYQQIDAATLPFTNVQTIPAGTQTATINGLDTTRAYYFAVTAYNSGGNESSYSNIVEVLAGWESPLTVKVNCTMKANFK